MLNVVHCPACSLKLHVPEDLLRKRVMCPTCGQKFEADTWVMEPDEIPTSTTGPAFRPTEEYRDAPVQEPAAHQASAEQPFQTRTPEPNPNMGARQGSTETPWVSSVQTRPGEVEAMGVMMLVGGIIALCIGVGSFRFHIFHFWSPFGIYSLIMGILAIIRGSRLLGRYGHFQRPPRAIAIMQIVNIINADVANLVMGIISLSFLKDPAVRRYFRC